jgi:hypothetical protein
VAVDTVITKIEEGENPEIWAAGYLKVDGLFICQMENFGLRPVSEPYFGRLSKRDLRD